MTTSVTAIDPFADIADLLPELEPHLYCDDISEIMVNPDGGVYIERAGLQERLGTRIQVERLASAVRRIACSLGDWIDEARPLLEARLRDGSRVACAWDPVSVGGISLDIRKFPKIRYSAAALLRMGGITRWQLDLLAAAVRDGKNILISGATGSGKSSLINALAEFIPDEERIITIEDVAELVLPATKENVVRYEAKRAQGEVPAVTIRQLLVHTLRMRPDRVILGEVRGAEAYDLLQVLTSGHRGSMSTIHADSAERAAERLTSLTLIAGVLPPIAVRGQIGSSIDYLVHIERNREGKRAVREIVRMKGYDYKSDQFLLERCEADAVVAYLPPRWPLNFGIFV